MPKQLITGENAVTSKAKAAWRIKNSPKSCSTDSLVCSAHTSNTKYIVRPELLDDHSNVI